MVGRINCETPSSKEHGVRKGRLTEVTVRKEEIHTRVVALHEQRIKQRRKVQGTCTPVSEVTSNDPWSFESITVLPLCADQLNGAGNLECDILHKNGLFSHKSRPLLATPKVSGIESGTW